MIDTTTYIRRRPGVRVGTLDQILATRVKIQWPFRINFQKSIDHNDIEEMKLWCENNCQDSYRAGNLHCSYFQFQNEQDALMFSLKWGSI